jgi:predicted nucleic acid-binding protein
VVTYVLDASALLRYVLDEAGAERVETVIWSYLRSEIHLEISAVQWGEVLGTILKSDGQAKLDKVLALLDPVGIDVVPVDKLRASRAAAIKFKHPIPYADAFAAELAMERGKILLTGDYDFAGMKTALKIEFLPRK